MAKIGLKKGIMDVVLYLVIFIVVQIAVLYAGAGIWTAVKQEGYMETVVAVSNGSNAVLLALATVFSNVITLVIFLKTKWTPLTRDYLQSKPWMDANTSKVFESLVKEPWGYVAVGILAPLAEEIVFRGAILRTLLGMVNKKNHWVAIMISAALFGAVHGNAAQLVNALLMGLLLGWMYYRTKSLVPGILMHWVNNTMAYVLSNLLPQSDGKLIDLFHGDEKTLYYAVGFSLCILIPSFVQMVLRLARPRC